MGRRRNARRHRGTVNAEAEIHDGTVTAAGWIVLIGSVTFAGSIIAAGKLQGLVPGQPIIFTGSRLVNAAWPSSRPAPPRSCSAPPACPRC
jgi:NAD/NADP transhydrogenase beta subunit